MGELGFTQTQVLKDSRGPAWELSHCHINPIWNVFHFEANILQACFLGESGPVGGPAYTQMRTHAMALPSLQGQAGVSHQGLACTEQRSSSSSYHPGAGWPPLGPAVRAGPYRTPQTHPAGTGRMSRVFSRATEERCSCTRSAPRRPDTVSEGPHRKTRLSGGKRRLLGQRGN